MKFRALLKFITFALLIVAISANFLEDPEDEKKPQKDGKKEGNFFGKVAQSVSNAFTSCFGAVEDEARQIMHTGASLSEQFCQKHKHYFEHLLHPHLHSKEEVESSVNNNSVKLVVEKPAAELVLHIWLRAANKSDIGVIFAKGGGGDLMLKPVAFSEECCDDAWFDFVEVPFDGKEKSTLHLSWSRLTTVVSYIYAFVPEQVEQKGTQVLYASEANKHPALLAEAFHMRSPVGWMNDPNAFSHTKNGVYHLFYQFNPHQRKWATMHWGHTISKDLVNWVQLPVFMRPEKKEVGGGRFSGSALPLGDGGLHIFYTGRTITKADPFEFDESQFSVQMDGKKILAPTGPPEIFLSQRPTPEKFTSDFRDPAVVIAPDGFYYMVLGTRFADLSAGATLLYRSKSAGNYSSGWEYRGIFHTDGRDKMKVDECNGLIPIGDPKNPNTLWAFIYGRDSSVDKDGRVNISPMLLTKFNKVEKTFQKLADNMEEGTNTSGYAPQEIDFAGGSYAYQGFYDESNKEALLIGWLWDCDDPNNCIASMTLPRKLALSEDKKAILQMPHPKLEKLRGKSLNLKNLATTGLELKAPGKLELEFKIDWTKIGEKGEVQLVVDLAGGKQKFSVVANSEGFKVVKTWQSTRNLIVRGAKPKEVRVFIDVDSVEVFADNGRWVGCARLVGNAVKVSLKDSQKAVSDVKAWQIDVKANIYKPGPEI